MLHPPKAAAVVVAGLALWSSGVAAEAASGSAKPTTTCSEWQAVGDSTVSTRTCLTVKPGKKTSQARGDVQVKNTGTETAKVKATWTVTYVAKGKKPAKVRTITIGRAVPANGHTYKLGGKSAYSKLNAAGLAEIQAKITVVAADSGTDKVEEEVKDDL
ncbi:MAG TPA: hypothetical protein VEQ66_02960 [Propionibacteriaceae bacterium]|nr:hypothetical protein [Propionibacteriaceae bacterium]